MTSSELKALYERNEEGGAHFFERSAMKFFGDTMANYGVRKVRVISKYDFSKISEPFEAWELYRIQPVIHGLNSSAYFSLDGKQLNGVKPLGDQQ